jgi:hypothetical protein
MCTHWYDYMVSSSRIPEYKSWNNFCTNFKKCMLKKYTIEWRNIHTRPLPNTYTYLQISASYSTVKLWGDQKRKLVLLMKTHYLTQMLKSITDRLGNLCTHTNNSILEILHAFTKIWRRKSTTLNSPASLLL